MSKVTLRAYNTVEVELFGHLFHSVDLPDSKAKHLTKITEGLRGVSDNADLADSDAEATRLMWDWFDTVLAPADDGKQKPSTVLKAKWDAEELTPRQVLGLYFDLSREIGEANKGPEDELLGELDRPT